MASKKNNKDGELNSTFGAKGTDPQFDRSYKDGESSFNFVNAVMWENKTDKKTRTVVMHNLAMENFDLIHKMTTDRLYSFHDKEKKLDASVSAYSAARRDNKRAWTHIISNTVIKPALANLLITEAERLEENDSTIVKQGLGSAGNVTSFESAATLSYKYNNIIGSVKKKNIVSNQIPLIKNDEERLIILEEVKFQRAGDTYSFNAFMIRPDVYDRLVKRYRMNRSDNITRAFSSIMNHETMLETAAQVLETKSLTSTDVTYYTEDNITTITDINRESMTVEGFSISGNEESVKYEDYYYIINPDLLLLLTTSDMQFDDETTRTVFVGKSFFSDKLGLHTTVYVPEAIKEIVVNGNVVKMTEEEKTEFLELKEAVNNEQALAYALKKEEDTNIALDKIAQSDDYKKFIIFRDMFENEKKDIFYDTEVKALHKSFRTDNDYLHNIDMEDVLYYPLSMFSLLSDIEQAKVTTNYDGSTTKDSDGNFVYSFGISSGDPDFFSTCGFKNAGVFNTLTNSSVELRQDIKDYALAIYTAEKSQFLDLMGKLTTQSQSNSGWIKDIKLTSVRTLARALDNAIRDDFMEISNSQEILIPSARPLVRTTSCIRQIDAAMSSNVVKDLNDSGKIEFTHFKNMEDAILKSDITILPSGIGYLVRDSLGNVINIHQLSNISIPVEVIFEEVNETPSTTTLEFERQSTTDRNDITSSFFSGSTYCEDERDMEKFTFQELVVGSTWKPLVDEDQLKVLYHTSVGQEGSVNRKITRKTVRNEYGVKVDYKNKETLEDFSSIVVCEGHDYKSVTGVDSVKLFDRLEKEFWYRLRVHFTPLDLDISRKVETRRCDLYEIMETFNETVALEIDKNLYSRFLTKEEMSLIRDFRISNRTYELSEGFKTAYDQIILEIDKKIQKLYPTRFKLYNILTDISKSKNRMNEVITEEFNAAIAKFGMVERLYMLTKLFSDSTKK